MKKHWLALLFLASLITAGFLFGPPLTDHTLARDDTKHSDAAPLPRPAGPSIDGYYLAKGRMALDNEGIIGAYASVVIITKEKNATYLVQWMQQGGPNSVGTGMMDGKKLVVGIGTPSGALGVVVYEIEYDAKDNPKLTGRWTLMPGNGNIHSEELTFLHPLVTIEKGK